MKDLEIMETFLLEPRVQVTGRSADCTEQCSIQVQAGRLRGCEAARLRG